MASTLLLGTGAGVCIAVGLIKYGLSPGHIVVMGLFLSILAPIFRSFERPDEENKPSTQTNKTQP
mgnify:CR=1 FL=1